MPAVKKRSAESQTLVREKNLSTIMYHLHQLAPLSRAALAEETGLNKTTVSSLVHELIEHGYIREGGLKSAGTGRPARMLSFNPQAGCIISAELGENFLLALVTNFSIEPLWRCKQSFNPQDESETVLAQMIALITQAINKGIELGLSVLGIAVSVPGLIDRQSGTMIFAPNLHWPDVPLQAKLEAIFDCPIFIDNDANLAALGEYYFGAAQNKTDILFVWAGIGLGGGIIRQGRIVYGGAGFAGEIGHMTMNPNGHMCSCGNRGCWETLAGQVALFKEIQRSIEAGQPANILLELAEHDLQNLSIELVAQAANEGDEVAYNALQLVGRHLGIGIASLVNALNPDIVVVGGAMSLAGGHILSIINAELEARALRWNRQTTEVVIAHHGMDACVIGGAAVVYQAILDQPGQIKRAQKV